MWTEMPKLGWMSSSQTQTISKFPRLRNSHITFESKSSRGKGTSQCGTEGATSAYQGSEFDVCFVFYVWRSLWCVYAFLTCHHIKRQGLAAQLTSAAWWQTSNEAYCLCADEITQSCACSMVMLFFFRSFLLDSIVSKRLVASICYIVYNNTYWV